jgi:hypothetical protein
MVPLNISTSFTVYTIVCIRESSFKSMYGNTRKVVCLTMMSLSGLMIFLELHGGNNKLMVRLQ